VKERGSTAFQTDFPDMNFFSSLIDGPEGPESEDEEMAKVCSLAISL
jgi:hypothetical protein